MLVKITLKQRVKVGSHPHACTIVVFQDSNSDTAAFSLNLFSNTGWTSSLVNTIPKVLKRLSPITILGILSVSFLRVLSDNTI